MGVITAPVVGSGCWPAWIARVPKRCFIGFFSMPSLQPPSQVAEEVRTSNETEKSSLVHDESNQAFVQHLIKLLDGGAWRQGLETAGHSIADRGSEPVLISLRREQKVGFVQDADAMTVLDN